jgi:hypothetical protein
MKRIDRRVQELIEEYQLRNGIPFGMTQDEFKGIIKSYLEERELYSIDDFSLIIQKRNFITLSDIGLLRKILDTNKDNCDKMDSTPDGYENFSAYRKCSFIKLIPEMIQDELRKLKRLIQFENGLWYNLSGERLLPKTCEYLYGVKPEVFKTMLHPDALIYKIELGYELNNRITHDLNLHLDIRCDKVINAIIHNKDLLKEMGIIYK